MVKILSLNANGKSFAVLIVDGSAGTNNIHASMHLISNCLLGQYVILTIKVMRIFSKLGEMVAKRWNLSVKNVDLFIDLVKQK